MSKNFGGGISWAIEKKFPPATRHDSLSDASNSLWNLFESCWALEPASRPGVENVMASHKHWHVNHANDLEQENQGEDIYVAFSSLTATHAAGRQSSISTPDSLFDSYWALEPVSRPDVENVMESHKQWNTAYAHDFDVPIKVVLTESTPRFNGSYSDVYIGRFRDNTVRLSDAPPNKN